MKKLHLLIGFVTLAAFLASGMYMRLHNPPVRALPDGTHMLFTSRHIYILGAALVHLVLGAYVAPMTSRAGRVTQMLGSVLLSIAPVLLIAAFLIEPGVGLPRTRYSQLGLYALFAGSLLHVVAALLSRSAPSVRDVSQTY